MAVRAEKLQVSPRALAPGTELDGWRILELMGESRCGVTYFVDSVAQPGSRCVLKLARELGEEQVGRELTLLMARGAHPHVARLRTCGRWPDPASGYLYFVMDWVPGYPLLTWTQIRNPSIGGLVEKLATVALTLEHLHSEGILHRDLRPEHIVIHQSTWKPFLIDFGRWRPPSAEGSTPWERVLGTLHLLSPEAVAFWRKHGGRPEAHYPYKTTDDVYALGVSVYRVLTGHWPYSPELSRQELFAAIERQEPPPLWKLNPRLPRALCEVVERMMARRVQDRFPSCAEVHAALVAAVSFAGPEAMELKLRASAPRPELSRAPAKSEAKASRSQGVNIAMVLVTLIALGGLTTQARLASRNAGSSRPEGPRAAAAADGTACSQFSIANMRDYSIGTLRLRPREHATHKGSRVIEVRDSQQVVWAMEDPWASRIPVGSLFHGRVWVSDRLYGRFDLMELPDGKKVRVCLEFWKNEYGTDSAGQGSSARLVPGIPLAQPSSEPGAGQVDIQEIEADVVRRWGSLKAGAN